MVDPARPDDPARADAPAPPERVVGRVVRAHGLRGELVVESRTDNVAERFAAGTVLTVSGGRPGPGPRPTSLTLTGVRRHGERLLVTVVEVSDRDAAEDLRSVLLTAPALAVETDDPDEFHDHQLEGLAVELGDGTVVGTVTEVLHGAGGELLAVERTPGPDGTGAGEVLVPFVAAIVVRVDVPGGRLVLDPPEGLLDPA